MEGTLNDRDDNFDPNPMARMDEEEAAAEERMAEEEKQKKKSADTDYPELFIDEEGQPFNPKKKYGTIQDEVLIYDNVTSSYPAILPTEHYHKYIMDNLPKKEDGNGKWFIRPHHLETLTKHPQSIRDDVLNTRYISNYNQEYGKEKAVSEAEQAIGKIESHLAELRGKMFTMMAQRGEDPEKFMQV